MQVGARLNWECKEKPLNILGTCALGIDFAGVVWDLTQPRGFGRGLGARLGKESIRLRLGMNYLNMCELFMMNYENL